MNLKNSLKKEYLNKTIFLYIIFSEQYIRNNILKKIVGNRSIIENRVNDFEGINDFMEKYILENKNNKEKCIKNGIKYFEIQEDYEIEIKNIYEWIERKTNEVNSNDVRPYFA